MCWNTSAVHVFGLCANASETPAVSARSLLSAARRSVRKSQTCRGGPYLLLAGSSVQLIFIGWLLLRTGLYELCRTEVGMKEVGGRRKLGREGGGGGAVPGWLVLTQIAEISVSVGKLYNLVSTFRRERVPTVTSVLIPSFPFSLPLLLTQSRPDLYV